MKCPGLPSGTFTTDNPTDKQCAYHRDKFLPEAGDACKFMRIPNLPQNTADIWMSLLNLGLCCPQKQGKPNQEIKLPAECIRHKRAFPEYNREIKRQKE